MRHDDENSGLKVDNEDLDGREEKTNRPKNDLDCASVAKSAHNFEVELQYSMSSVWLA